MTRIPATDKLLSELWVHASSNRTGNMKAFYNGELLMSYSARHRSIVTYRVDKVMKSMMGDGMKTFIPKLLDGQPVLEETGEDPSRYIKAIVSLTGDKAKMERMPIDPSKANAPLMYAVLGHANRGRLRPHTMTRHYHELMRCDRFWWLHGDRSDLILLR